MGLITEDVNKSMNKIVEKVRLISNKHVPYHLSISEFLQTALKPGLLSPSNSKERNTHNVETSETISDGTECNVQL